MRSLRFKILGVAAALVLLSQAGTVMTVLVTANRDVAQRAQKALDAGIRIFEQMSTSRAAQLRNTVGVLAADYAFKQAVATRDFATIGSALVNHAQRAGADLALLLDDDGKVVASTHQSLAVLPAQRALIRHATEKGSSRSTLVQGEAAYEMLMVPVRAPLPIGWISMGFLLDDSYVRRIGDLAGLHVSLVSLDGSVPIVVASTLTAAERSDLRRLAAEIPGGSSGTFRMAGADHLVVTRPFMTGSRDLQVLITESLAEAMAPYRLLRTAAIVLGLLPLLLALAGAALLSRTLAKPVQQLAEAAKRMKVGDYSRTVSVTTGDELQELAVTFNAMQEDIARREARITYQARHDSLTGLPNRDFALEFLDREIAPGRMNQSVAVVMLNLNGIAEIATSLGHDIADDYLRRAAEQLRLLIDSRFTIARIESDSFLIVMPGVSAENATDFADRLLQRLEPGIGLPDLTVSVHPKIGIAVYPDHGEAHDQLLLRATIAQTDGRSADGIGLYHGGDEERRLRRLTILADLRRAVRHEELRLFYQPKIAVADGRIVGAEALVRWDHPSLGRISPAEFIPIAEQSGNISIITHWALTAAARECRFWLEEGIDLTVSVNLSAHDLLDKDLPWHVVDVLRNHDLASRHLVAEITEEALVRDFEHATVVLHRLRELGIRISIDDFGVGYSSLAQIRNLPVDELKIDRSFVTHLPDNRADAAIVGAAIDLAHNLGLEFVAEGVETAAALRWLASHGCERAQGFYIGEPVEDFIGWMRNYQRARPDLKAG